MDRTARVIGVWIVGCLIVGGSLILANLPGPADSWTDQRLWLVRLGALAIGFGVVGLVAEGVVLLRRWRRRQDSHARLVLTEANHEIQIDPGPPTSLRVVGRAWFRNTGDSDLEYSIEQASIEVAGVITPATPPAENRFRVPARETRFLYVGPVAAPVSNPVESTLGYAILVGQANRPPTARVSGRLKIRSSFDPSNPIAFNSTFEPLSEHEEPIKRPNPVAQRFLRRSKHDR